jgi:hypothetical protein
MADEFNLFLREALAPPARGPDRQFVARVETRIALDERLQAERGGLLRQLGMEVLALAAIAAGLLWLGRAPAVAEFVEHSPAIALSALLAGFTLMILVVAVQAGGRTAERR